MDAFAIIDYDPRYQHELEEISLPWLLEHDLLEPVDLEMLAAVCQAVKVPVIASGGAGRAEDFVRLFQTLPGVDAGLAASVFHFGEIAIPHLKAQLRQAGISVR